MVNIFGDHGSGQPPGPRGTHGLQGSQGPKKGDRGKCGKRGITDLYIWLPDFVLQEFRKIWF